MTIGAILISLSEFDLQLSPRIMQTNHCGDEFFHAPGPMELMAKWGRAVALPQTDASAGLDWQSQLRCQALSHAGNPNESA